MIIFRNTEIVSTLNMFRFMFRFMCFNRFALYMFIESFDCTYCLVDACVVEHVRTEFWLIIRVVCVCVQLTLH